ncbi:MAG TPA: hypothetical protein VGL97_17495 [Bryobacteraceae bacterium]|jgi:hypothetical protein
MSKLGERCAGEGAFFVTYDFLAIVSLNKELVNLAGCESIGRCEYVLALGNGGTGKTHIGFFLRLAVYWAA